MTISTKKEKKPNAVWKFMSASLLSSADQLAASTT